MNRKVLLALTAAAAIFAHAESNIGAAYQAIPDEIGDLGIERLAAILSPEEFSQITNLIGALTVYITETSKDLEKTDAGRKQLHGSIVSQIVDMQHGKNIHVFADGFVYTNSFQTVKSKTVEERAIEIARKIAEEQKRKRAAARANMPPGLQEIDVQREANEGVTNYVEGVITPEVHQ